MLASDRYDSPASARVRALRNLQITDLPGVVVGVEHWLKIALSVAGEAFRDCSEPFALRLRALDVRLRAFDESAAFLFGDRCGYIGDELAGPIGADLLNPSIGNRDSRAGLLAFLEKVLVDTSETCETRDFPHDDVLILTGADSFDKLGELLATGVGPD
jgi:hypothetical protein